MKRTLILMFLLSLTLGLFSQESSREKINDNWQFVQGDLGGPYDAMRKSFNRTVMWSKVQLPHCFNAFDALDPDVKYYEGPGWYKRKLTISQSLQNKKVFLHFEGAGQKSTVFINEEKVGHHVGGYDEWRVDITDALQSSGKKENLLIVRCDNSRDLEMIPSDMSDFNVYGGLYRNVWVEVVPETYLEQVWIKPEVEKNLKSGKLNISAEIATNVCEGNTFRVKLTDPEGKEVLNETATVNEVGEVSYDIKRVKLWSPNDPQLYTCDVSIESSKGVHTKSYNIGFRTFRFEKKGPFFLNGERLLLRGTHRHEDHAGYGAATPDAIVRKEMQMMKDMGVNFLRLGHYQQSELVGHLCDSLGIITWEEIPWCRGGLGGEAYQEQGKRMLRNMIKQHYNHPSVVLWGLGNENDWAGDFKTFDKQAIRNYMSELNDIAHELDPERKTSIRRCGFCADIVDVYSPSIWAGWYRGKYTEYRKVSKMEADKVDHFLHVEWGGSSHARRHSESPDKGLENIPVGQGADERDGDFLLYGGNIRASKDGDWSESYICNVFDWHLKEQEKMEWLTGTAQWVFKDFSTPLRPDNPIPYVNQKGVIQRDLTPKESYYLFQSYWTEKPMIHIYGHTWPVRWGEQDEVKMIKVFSNCKTVELFLNGKSMGVRKRNSQDFPAAGLRWNVKFNAGDNHIKVIGKKDGVVLEDEITQYYETRKWGEAKNIAVKMVKNTDNKALYEVVVTDDKGVVCLDSKKWISFQVMGKHQLVENMGTVNGSRKIQLANGRAWTTINLKEGKSILRVVVGDEIEETYIINPDGSLFHFCHDTKTKQKSLGCL
ncbi:glycoside hydrolase family 2 protein [Puteibacter caeruleilacunae]|nr:glycoside hydrolase family 2 protein [Puteibacter caeruleilacunae]